MCPVFNWPIFNWPYLHCTLMFDLVTLALKFYLLFKNFIIAMFMLLPPVSYVVFLTTPVSTLLVFPPSVHLSDCQSEKLSWRFRLEVWRFFFRRPIRRKMRFNCGRLTAILCMHNRNIMLSLYLYPILQ